MRYLSIFILLIVFLFGCNQKSVNGSTITFKIDSIFSAYQTGPGCAVGVIKDGQPIFSKGYGYANLDYDIPITDNSKFYIGSMAKQFCGAALLKLESEGKVNFQDPITRYLPDFPVYEEEITVDHIIHHTSGIRGTSSMQLIAGIDHNFEEHFTANRQYEMIKAQKALNFSPGTEYRYSSGGYIVLAKLVEAVSGKSFRNYLDEYFFQPLGMNNTFVIDDHNEIVKDRVISYFPVDKGFERRSMIFDGMGDGSILTTVNDLLRWDQAFYDDSLLSIPNFAERMYNTGKVLSWANQYYGMALQTEKYKGYDMVAHNGGMLGFRADLVRFPKERLSVIVLANHADIHSTYYAQQVVDLFLPSKEIKEEKRQLTPTSLSKKHGERLSGKYFSHDINNWRKISWEDDTLYYDSGNEHYRTPLRKVDENEFFIDAFDLPASLRFEGDRLYMDYGWTKKTFTKFDDSQPTLEDLRKYHGTYYSQELNIYYKVYKKEDKVYVQIKNNEPILVFPKPINPRINWNSKNMVWIGFAMMKFQFDEDKKVNGFLIGDNRVKGIWFKKI